MPFLSDVGVDWAPHSGRMSIASPGTSHRDLSLPHPISFATGYICFSQLRANYRSACHAPSSIFPRHLIFQHGIGIGSRCEATDLIPFY